MIFTVLLTVPSSAQVISELQSDGNLYVNGEAFLPVGFYCEGMAFDEYPDIPERIAAGGFNCLYTESSVSSAEDYAEFFDQCEDLGLKNLLGLPYSFLDPEDYEFFINQYKNQPSVISWNILDDANDFGAEEIAQQRDILLELDDTRVTSTSWYTDGPLTEMLPFVEIGGMQAYPWGDWGDLVASHATFTSLADTARMQGKFPISSPQAFNWDDETYPPAAHLDCQTYLGFITGMKGVLFYTFKDYDNDSTIDETQPELYAVAANIAEEVLQSELKDVLLFGEHQAEVIDFYRYYATWRHNDFVYLIAVNANAAQTYYYNIPLPEDIVGEAVNLFENRPDNLAISGGNLVGNLSPYQVAVYRFNTTATATTSVFTSEGMTISPNPAGEQTEITYVLTEKSNLNLELYDAYGRVVFSEKIIQNAGQHSKTLDVADYPSGVYFLRLSARGEEGKSVRLVLL